MRETGASSTERGENLPAPGAATASRDIEAQLRFDLVSHRLLDRIMPLPVSLASVLSALVGERPWAILAVSALAVVSHVSLSRLLYEQGALSGRLLQRLPILRILVANAHTLAVYVLGGPEANAWFLAGPMVIGCSFVHARWGACQSVSLIVLMGLAGWAMGVETRRIATIAGSLSTIAVISHPIAQALRERAESLFSAAQAAERANEAKSRFVATMSHEIRTPLNGMLGMVDLLAKTPLRHDQLDLIAHLRTSSDLLHGIVNDILDFSKIEAGKLQLESHPFPPAELARHCVATMRPAAMDKGLSLDLELADAIPAWLEGDPKRLQQVILNLLSNATKFTSRGRVTLHAGYAAGVLEIAVADTGIGIQDAAMRRLFRPFEQGDSSTSRRFGGTGLGLSICARLTRLMGGSIEAESTPGEGSRFRVRVPLREVRPPETALPLGSLPQVQGRVLVAEDNAINRIVIERLLEQRGLEVTLVENGAEAVKISATEAFDLVLMDCHMPELDGFAACEAIRRREAIEDGARERLPIVALTADTSLATHTRCEQAGMDGVVTKPIDTEELDRAIARTLIGAAR